MWQILKIIKMIFFLFVKNITYYVLSTHISLYMYKNTFFALIFGFHYSHTASEVVGKRNVDLLGLSIFFFFRHGILLVTCSGQD